jgi:hypothetical protein
MPLAAIANWIEGTCGEATPAPRFARRTSRFARKLRELFPGRAASIARARIVR